MKFCGQCTMISFWLQGVSLTIWYRLAEWNSTHIYVITICLCAWYLMMSNEFGAWYHSAGMFVAPLASLSPRTNLKSTPSRWVASGIKLGLQVPQASPIYFVTKTKTTWLICGKRWNSRFSEIHPFHMIIVLWKSTQSRSSASTIRRINCVLLAVPKITKGP